MTTERNFPVLYLVIPCYNEEAVLPETTKRLTEKMRDDLTRCDDDHEHVEPNYAAAPSEKRAEQLREMLKNGIIEKEEYNILMRKYGLK